MLAKALDALEEAEVSSDAITVVPVPGAFELPLAAMALAKTRRYACVVALGAIVRGETPHFDFVASEAASGLQLAAIETGVPVAFGVLTVETVEQGEAGIDRAARRGAHRARDGRPVRAAARERALNPARAAISSLQWPAVSKVCSVCGKKPGFGNNRSHSMVATKRRFNPNLQRVRLLVNGVKKRAYVCTRCLKGNKVQKAV